MSSLPARIKRIGSKATGKRWRHCFPHYKSMGAFCCHGNQSFDPICPKTLCSLSPIPVMLHIKFDQDWPTGFRDIQVWKCGRWRTMMDDDDDGRLVYYLVSLWIRWAKNWNCKKLQYKNSKSVTLTLKSYTGFGIVLHKILDQRLSSCQTWNKYTTEFRNNEVLRTLT